MCEVINIRDQSEWSDITLAKRQLAWSRAQQTKLRNDPRFDFDESITKEENIIRSFFDRLKGQSEAA